MGERQQDLIPRPSDMANAAEEENTAAATLLELEAALLCSPQPIAISLLVRWLGLNDERGLNLQVRALNEVYASSGRSFRIERLGTTYQLRTLPRFAARLQTLFQRPPPPITPSMQEVLALVAYRQPLTRATIEEVRGVDSSSSLRSLLRLKLVRIAGRGEGPGRPLIYRTTKEFLSLFHLRSLESLPAPEEV